MKNKTWLAIWLVIVILLLGICGYWVYYVDPYFHYHKPHTDEYYYVLNNQRSQNNGIIRHFDYDALITGTSMTENFRSSELDKLFGCNSIKVPFEGGSYKEINDNIRVALEVNPELRLIVRCLDMSYFFDSADHMRTDLGEFPTYLYDNIFLNDIGYLFNRDVLFERVFGTIHDKKNGWYNPGITSFDDYSKWQDAYSFGKNSVCPEGVAFTNNSEIAHLSQEEKYIIKENIEKNVTNLAEEHKDVEFYYYYSPYSASWWCNMANNGELYKRLDAEKYISELIVQHDNIHLFSFNNRTDIITDLNNYKDEEHYAAWINSLILKWMHDDQYRITSDNLEEYYQKEYDFYTSFDYNSLNGQEDYEADYYAAALLNKELTGVSPTNIEYNGNEFSYNFSDGHNYLAFYAKKISDIDEIAVKIYDKDHNWKKEFDFAVTDDNEHFYVVDLSDFDQEIIAEFTCNGGDESGVGCEYGIRGSSIY